MDVRTAKTSEDRAARLTAIRARRGTSQRDANIKAIAEAKARRVATEAATAAADAAWERKFNRADLRTQALMLADDGFAGPAISVMMRQLAATIPAGLR